MHLRDIDFKNNLTRNVERRSKSFIVIIIVVAVIATVLGISAFAPLTFDVGKILESYPTVTVKGTVKTVAAYPVMVYFIDGAGNRFSATVEHGPYDINLPNRPFDAGSYNITLPNRMSYKVIVGFVAAAGLAKVLSGTCEGEILNLDLDVYTYTYNISC